MIGTYDRLRNRGDEIARGKECEIKRDFIKSKYFKEGFIKSKWFYGYSDPPKQKFNHN